MFNCTEERHYMVGGVAERKGVVGESGGTKLGCQESGAVMRVLCAYVANRHSTFFFFFPKVFVRCHGG